MKENVVSMKVQNKLKVLNCLSTLSKYSDPSLYEELFLPNIENIVVQSTTVNHKLEIRTWNLNSMS